MKVTLQAVAIRGTTASGFISYNGVDVPVTVTLGRRELKRAFDMAKREMAAHHHAMVRQIRSSVSGDMEIGFVKKLFRKAGKALRKASPKFVKKAVTKLAKTKLGRFAVKKMGQLLTFTEKVGATIKKIAQHPAFQAAVFAISQVVPGAGALGVVYVAAMAAVRMAEGLSKGDPKALAELGNIASAAAQGSPQAAEFMDRFEGIKQIAQSKDLGQAVSRGAEMLHGVPGLGSIPKEVGTALSLVRGLGSSDPAATDALKHYAARATQGDPRASAVISAFEKVRDMSKQTPDLKKILEASAISAVNTAA